MPSRLRKKAAPPPRRKQALLLEEAGETSTKGRWGQSAPAYPEAPGLPPAEVAAVDMYWATRGTSWDGPPLPDQYAPDTLEPVQEESEEEVTYEFFGEAAELPEPTEEPPSPEQGPQQIEVIDDEYNNFRIPMTRLPVSDWPKAPPSSSPLVSGEQVHAGNTDDIIGIPRALLERNSVRAFVADADAGTNMGPEKQQNDEASRHKYYQKTVGYRAEPETWHQRLGHPSHATLKNSLKAGVFDDDVLLLPHGGSLTAESANPPCTVCLTASLAHKPFPYLPPGYERYKSLDKVYSDFMVLSQTGLNGEFYTLTLINACTLYVWAVNNDCRSLAFECFVVWMKRAEPRRSPDVELPPNTSQDTLRLGNDSDDDVVEVTSFHNYDRLHFEKTNETGLHILGLTVAVRHASPKEPTTVRQALPGPDSEKWKAAMAAEVAALKSCGTWKLVPRSSAKGRKILSGKWVFRIKKLADGSIDKYRAIWVVHDFEQTHMVDFDLTYASVGSHTSVRILICIAAIKQRPLRQIDVGSAFLYAPVDSIIFAEQLHAFEDADNDVCLLQRSLYGIKQAPRLWHQYMHTILTELGFTQLSHDLGMYRKESRGKFILLVAYVDDLLYTGNDMELLDRFEADIKEKLELTINHNVTQFLGLNITQSATSTHLYAAKYAETLAEKFAVTPINLTTPFRTPPPNHKPDTTLLSIEDHRLYQQQVGCLLFAAITCRPDLSYVASKLAQYLKRPEGENLLDLRRALQYFVSTPDVGLTYKANLTSTLQLHGYVGADHAGDIDNRRSRTGFIFQLQPTGLISWNSQKQELIAILSAEAEFIAARAAIREGLYLMELLQEAKVTMNGHFTLLCDNQSAIKITNKPGFVNRTKHITLRYFFVKDEIDKGKVKLTYSPTGDMAADFLTKKLPRQKFQHCTNLCWISKKSHVAHLQE
ncbi:unnamed protein product [Closterium sp. NIES-54]